MRSHIQAFIILTWRCLVLDFAGTNLWLSVYSYIQANGIQSYMHIISTGVDATKATMHPVVWHEHRPVRWTPWTRRVFRLPSRRHHPGRPPETLRPIEPPEGRREQSMLHLRSGAACKEGPRSNLFRGAL